MIPASKSKRLMAYVIDSLILLKLSKIFLLALVIVGALCVGKNNVESFSLLVLKFSPIICCVLVSLYYVLLESSSKHQGTIGKTLLNLYVSDGMNKKISFTRALSRHSLLIIAALPIYIISYSEIFSVKGFADNYWLNLMAPILLLSSLAPVYFTREKTTFYDMVSCTRVNFKPGVEEKKWTRIIIFAVLALSCLELMKFLGWMKN